MVVLDEKIHYHLLDGTDLVVDGKALDISVKHQVIVDAVAEYNSEFGEDVMYVYIPEFDYFAFAINRVDDNEIENQAVDSFAAFLTRNNIEFN